MNITSLKRFSSLLIIAVFACSFIYPVATPDFSGSWGLNEGKSELGQFGARGAASKIVVAQKADAVTVTKTSNFQGEEISATETLAFDGKESETTVFGSSKKKSNLKWSADRQSFTVTYSIAFERNGQTFDLKGVETWSLGADGKSLSIQTALTTPQGDITTKASYDKN